MYQKCKDSYLYTEENDTGCGLCSLYTMVHSRTDITGQFAEANSAFGGMLKHKI